MEQELQSVLRSFKDRVLVYLELKSGLIKLTVYEKTAKVVATLAHSLVLLLLGFFVMLFLFLSLGFYLGEITGRLSLGFLMVTGLYLLLFGIVFFVRHSIRLKITNLVLGSLLEDEPTADSDTLNTPTHEDTDTAGTTES